MKLLLGGWISVSLPRASLWHLQVLTLVLPVYYYSRALVHTDLDLAIYLEGKMSDMVQTLRDGSDKCVTVCILWVFFEQLRLEFAVRFSLDYQSSPSALFNYKKHLYHQGTFVELSARTRINC